MKRYQVLQIVALAAVAVAFHLGWIDAPTAGVLFVGMAQPADSLSITDLKAVGANGLVAEDVLQQIYDVSEGINTPFLDMIGEGTCKNNFTEWTQDVLRSPTTDASNTAIDGADFAPATAATGARVGNHTQINILGVNVTEGSEHSDNFGRTLAYRTMREIKQMRRDVEAYALGIQASVLGTESVKGVAGGFGAWLETNTSHGANAGAAGGFNTSTKVVDAVTPGDGRALTWEMVADAIESVYGQGANPTVLMSVPGITKRLGRFLFSSSAYAATPTANVTGTAPASQTSQGYIDTIRTDFGFTMNLVPNRLQQVYDSGDAVPVDVAALFGIDPQFVDIANLWNVKVEPLAKTGLSTRRMISRSWTLRVKNEKAHFGIFDLIPTSAVAAS